MATTRGDLFTPGMKNFWVERGESPNDANAHGVCLLDTMTDEQVTYVLERDPWARADLRLITTDPVLLGLADTVPMLSTVDERDSDQRLLNRPHEPASIPFYAQFRGQLPFPY